MSPGEGQGEGPSNEGEGASRVERDDNRRLKTYAVREKFSLFLIFWVDTETLLFLLCMIIMI